MIFFGFAAALQAALPEWIWHDNKGAIQTNETRFFRKIFKVERNPSKARLSLAADDEAVVYLNGKEIARSTGFDKATYEDVASDIVTGENVLAVRGKNVASDIAGVIVILELQTSKNPKQVIMTDTTWVSSAKSEPDWEVQSFPLNSCLQLKQLLNSLLLRLFYLECSSLRVSGNPRQNIR